MEKNVPEKRFIAGAISATIWKNQAESKVGKEISYETISISRNFKTENGEWKSTNTLRLNDLPKATVVLNKAYEYLTLREAEI
jgi:hypothetical protein